MASRVQCWRTKTTWSGRPGERNAFRPHFVVHPHRLLQSNLRAARIVIGRPCRIDGTQPSNCAAWAKIHNNLYSDEPRSAASRLSRPCLPRPCPDVFASVHLRETNAVVWRGRLEKPSPNAYRTSASAALLCRASSGAREVGHSLQVPADNGLLNHRTTNAKHQRLAGKP
jgi:hypothetical protein